MALLNTIGQIQERTEGLQRAVDELLDIARTLSPEQMEFLPSNSRQLERTLQEIVGAERTVLQARHTAHTIRTRINPDGTSEVLSKEKRGK